jgi:hypothetical protein
MLGQGWASLRAGWQRLWKRKPAEDDDEVSPERIRRILSEHGLKLTAKGEAVLDGTYQPFQKYHDPRFRENLVGHWQTLCDSSQSDDDNLWTFRPDGTGEFVETDSPAPLGLRVRFVWETVGDYHVRVRALGEEVYNAEDKAFIPSPEDPAHDDPDALSWQSFAYETLRNEEGEIRLRGELPLFPYVVPYPEPDGLRFIGVWSGER